MRKALKAGVVIIAIIALDLVLANFAFSVPTSEAISSVERSEAFQGIVGNGTYTYFKYSDNPSWDVQCVSSVFANALHFVDPFHEYTTSTLIFFVQPNVTLPKGYSGPAKDLPFVVLVKVNPASGEIHGIQTEQICV